MTKCAVVLGITMLLAACGSTDQQQQPVSPGGIWSGNFAFYGGIGQGLINEQGNGYFAMNRPFGTPDVVIYRIAVQPEGSDITGAYTGFELNGALPDGLTVDNGTISGSVTLAAAAGSPLSFIIGALSLPATVNPVGGIGFNVSYNVLYNHPASLATIAGSYQSAISARVKAPSDPSSPGITANGTLLVAADGSFTLVDDAGCTLTGGFTVPNPQVNDYELKGSLACSDDSVVALSGAVTGFAYFTPAAAASSDGTTPATPASLTIEYDDGKTAASFGTATVPAAAPPES